MRKKGVCLCLAIVCGMGISSKTWAVEQYDNLSDLGLSAKSTILMEQDSGTILYEQNSHEALPPASVTKVMTMLLIYEAEQAGQFAWDDTVTVSEHAASMGGSQVFLEEGETQTAADMTKCIAIASANDAAVAMAEFVAGSEDAFVQKMNARAQELGMADTHFENACGLDTDGHVTSAYDIALMSRELMRNFPEIQQYTTTWQDSIIHQTKRGEETFGLTNTNKLIQWYDGATGLKTGSTGNALYCLSATAERDGMNLIAVVMAAPDFKARFQEAMQLLDYGFANYVVETGREKGYVAGQVPVSKGSMAMVDAVTAEEISVLLPKNGDATWESEVSLLSGVQAPVTSGAKVGEMVYTLEGTEVGRVDLVAAQEVPKAGMEQMLQRMLYAWC